MLTLKEYRSLLQDHFTMYEICEMHEIDIRSLKSLLNQWGLLDMRTPENYYKLRNDGMLDKEIELLWGMANRGLTDWKVRKNINPLPHGGRHEQDQLQSYKWSKEELKQVKEFIKENGKYYGYTRDLSRIVGKSPDQVMYKVHWLKKKGELAV